MWIILTLFSSIFLGAYDLLRKASLKENAVIPVLFLGSASASLFFSVLVGLSRMEIISNDSFFYVVSATPKEHLMYFLKSVIVGSSWVASYFALKHLPITIVIPIRATGPFWTIIGALLIYQERFNSYQWVGIVLVMAFFYYFSLAGQKEGVDFRRNKWIFLIILATILGSISSMYDKFLMARYDRVAVQAWFSIYMLIVFFPFVAFMWYPTRKQTTKFQWRLAIPLIGLTLTVADYFYFFALSDPDSLIGIVSVLRRSSVIMSFVLGAIIFKEVNLKRKAIALIGITIGIVFILVGGRGALKAGSGSKEQTSFVTNTELKRSSGEVKYADGFRLISEEDYSIIEIINPWKTGEVLASYLVKKDESKNINYPKTDFVFDMPVSEVITQSTTGSAYFSQLGLQSLITAACDAQYICDTVLYQRYKQGKLINLGNSNAISIESIIGQQPEVYIKYIYKTIEDSDRKIIASGIPIVYLTEYMEREPLGRAEWIKVIGVLTGHEDEADSIFTTIEKNYQYLRNKVAELDTRPRILAGSNFKGTWYVPGGNSFVARLIKDAGGDYFMKSDSGTGSIPLSFEFVYKKQLDCPIWINANANSLDELKSTDTRYANLTAVKEKNVYHFNKLINPEGGVGYFELGVVRPDILLSDLIQIFHPEFNGERETVFWRRLE